MEKIMNLLKGKKSGITLIEALIVFAAGVGLIAGGLKLYGNLQNSTNVKNESTNISSIAKRMNELFSEDDLTDVTMPDDLVVGGVFPNGMKIKSNIVTHAWNDVVEIAATGASAWKLTYKQVATGDSCIDLVTATRKMGFDQITINGAAYEASDITISNIIENCDATGTVNYVDIVWEYT
jgi:hypothetical protein